MYFNRGRKILERYEKENDLGFGDDFILPQEQIEVFKEVLSYNKKRNKKEKSNLDRETEIRYQENIAQKIVDKMQDPRLKEKGKISSCVLSTGGSMTQSNQEGKNAEYILTGARTSYVVMSLNGLMILEPIGQPDNATYVTYNNDQIKDDLKKFGRETAIKQGKIYCIQHEARNISGYDYESNHLFDIIEYAIANPNELMEALKQNNIRCALKTLTQRMLSITGIDPAIAAVQEAVQEKNVSKDDIISQDSNSVEIQNTSAEQDSKTEPGIEIDDN